MNDDQGMQWWAEEGCWWEYREWKSEMDKNRNEPDCQEETNEL